MISHKSIIYTLFVLSFFQSILADINFKHCLGPVDLGRNPAKGILPNVCIKDHHFKNKTHSWFFGRSIVKNTNFTRCTFEKEGPHSFWRVHWENVIFESCVFRRSEEMIFTETSMVSVVFQNCVFEESAHMVFSKFSFSNVEFRNCTFLSTIHFTLGNLQRTTILDSILGNEEGGSDESGDLLFSEVSIEGLNIIDSTSAAEVRIQQSQVSDLQIYDSQLHHVSCHEDVIFGKDVKQASILNDTVCERVTLTDGFYCDHSTIFQGEMHNISVRNTFSLASSDIENFVLSNLTSVDDTCSTFDVSEATVDGGRLELLSTTKATFAKTEFTSHTAMPGLKLSESNYDFRKTLFAPEMELINDECCVIACLKKECLCDVAAEPLFCPKGNSSVNVNVKDSCFPADATVYVVNKDGSVEQKAMQSIRHGDRVLTGHLEPASEIYFFGHRSGEEYALFKIIATTGSKDDNKLVISGGHLIPTVGRGLLAASGIIPGDVLLDVDGREVYVIGVHEEVRRGMYAPTTMNGNIIVNGIRTSCYTNVLPESVAHGLLAPLRALYSCGAWGRRIVERVGIFHKWSPAALFRQRFARRPRLRLGNVAALFDIL